MGRCGLRSASERTLPLILRPSDLVANLLLACPPIAVAFPPICPPKPDSASLSSGSSPRSFARRMITVSSAARSFSAPTTRPTFTTSPPRFLAMAAWGGGGGVEGGGRRAVGGETSGGGVVRSGSSGARYGAMAVRWCVAEQGGAEWGAMSQGGTEWGAMSTRGVKP